MVLLALPQLYRVKSRTSQQIRVVLGPLTPLLAVNNLVMEPSCVATVAGFVVSILAFVVFRPDNEAMLALIF